MKVSIVIVSYNVKDFITQCIRSIYKSNLNKNDYEIIVIDNDSHDDTVLTIEEEFQEVIIIKNDNNEGFSKAVNKGVDASKGKNICIINPDVIIKNDTLSNLLTKIECNEKIGAIGPRVINTDGTIQHSCKRSFPTPVNSLFRLFKLDKLFPKNKIFGNYNLTYLNIDKEHEVDVLSGAFMLIPRKIFNLVDGFDERFFMFGEDIDLCHKIKDQGYKIIYSPITEIIHYKGESVKNAPYDMINVFYSAMDIYYHKYSTKYKYWKLISALVKVVLYFRKSFSLFKMLLSNLLTLFIDLLFIFISFAISIFIWYSSQYYEIVDFSKVTYHLLLIINFMLSWLISSKIMSLYKKGTFSITRLLLTIIITFLISSTSTYFISFFAYSRGVLLLSAISSFIFLLIWRITAKFLYLNKILHFKSISRYIERRAILIGADEETIKIGQKIQNFPESEINIIGYTDTSNPLFIDKFLGRVQHLKDITIKNKITEIIIREEYLVKFEIFSIIKKLKGLNLLFKVIPKGNNIILSKGEIENISGIELMSYDIPFLERSNIIIKRFFDIILSIVLLFLTMPLHIILYIIYGYKNTKMWTIENKHINIKSFNIKNNFLKKIPILFSILNGKISFVGSRLTSINEEYPSHILKPGLLSLNNTKKFKNNNEQRLETYYIKNQSLTFDLEIILKTFFKV
tara:strand:- start:2316 stop:4367 length:2052 start_codon:yes stop_codon:yes gene_type:complete